MLGIKEFRLTIKHLQFCWGLYRSAGCGELPLQPLEFWVPKMFGEIHVSMDWFKGKS